MFSKNNFWKTLICKRNFTILLHIYIKLFFMFSKYNTTILDKIVVLYFENLIIS
jgi:hypothetical protein